MRRELVVASLVVATARLASAETAAVAGDFVRNQPAQALPASAQTAVRGITAPALAAHVAFLASPALEGRGLDTRGLDGAAAYAATQLALAGVAPLRTDASAGGQAAYFQTVPVRAIRNLTARLVITHRRRELVREHRFAAGVDCQFSAGPPLRLQADVVFAGYGIREAALGHDDYRGIEVRDRVVVVLAGVPAGAAWDRPGLRERYASDASPTRHAAKLATARDLNAAALVVVEDEGFVPALAAPTAGVESSFRAFDDGPAGAAETPLVRISTAAADAIFAAADLDRATARRATSRLLPRTTVTLEREASERVLTSRNVLGILPGSGANLTSTAVVLGAHLDHLGRIGPTVYPGADDNASGVAALLEIARACAAAPTRPKRTVVFAFWTGEEEGKFGSGHYVRHPAWPLDRTVAYLNLDMIGHPWSLDEIRTLVTDARLPDGASFLAGLDPTTFVEPGLPEDAPQVAEALRRAARATGLALHLDRTDGTQGGSDYRDFARAGVPWIRFFGNFFPGYHEVGDTPERLDPAQVRRVACLALATAWLLADS